MKDLFSLEGKTIAVIGAGSGIGRAVAIGIAEQGGEVFCLDIDAARAADTAKHIVDAGGNAAAWRKRAGDPISCDIADLTSVRDGITEAFSRHDRLDGVVC